MVEAQAVNVAEAVQLLQEGAFLLDVREDNEWAAGRAASATHLALNDVPDQWQDLPNERLIVCVCRSGARSGRATKFLVEQGRNAVNLEGGMLAWHAEGEAIVGDVGEPTII